MNAPQQPMPRREFFRAVVRVFSLGGLGMLAVIWGKRPKPASLPGQTCENRGVCGSCATFARCELPQALSARAVGRRPS
jgi:hypothetical protein